MSEKTRNMWRLLRDGPGEPSWNMAVDQVLLEGCQQGTSPPTLRLYRWTTPTVSMGRFQPLSDLDLETCAARGFSVVRRVTGGRALLHQHELTYSLAAPIRPLFPKTLSGTYALVARALIRALGHLGVIAEAVRPGQISRKTRASCFLAPGLQEICVGGKKLVGSAQRRLPKAFLQHGSLLLNLDPEAFSAVYALPPEERRRLKEETRLCVTSLKDLRVTCPVESVEAALMRGFSEVLNISLDPAPLTAQEVQEVRLRAQENETVFTP